VFLNNLQLGEVLLKKKRVSFAFIFIMIVAIGGFRIFCGVFVVQPIGAIPEGVTIVYWRHGLNLPFISSPDGILENSGLGVSLLGRGMVLGTLADPILERELFRVRYSETLYTWSTGGWKYER